MQRFMRSAAMTAVMLAAVGCGRTQSHEVVFAHAGPLREHYGQMTRRGFELALSHIRGDESFAGLTIDTILVDDGADGRKALEAAQRFVDDPRVVGVVGHVTSGAMKAAAHIYDGRLAAIATSASSPELTGISPWVFRVIPSDSATGVALAKHAKALGRSRVAILYENNAYGRGLTDAFRRSHSGAIVSIDPIGESAGQDFEPFVAFFQRTKPDLVFVAGTEVTGLDLVRSLREAGVTADLMGGDGWTGLTADPIASEGAIVAAPFTPLDMRAPAQRFVAAFRAQFKMEPDGNAALAYDATMMLARAVSAVGSDRAKVRDWLASRTEKTAHDGVTGRLRFDPAGDPVGKSLIMTRVRKGVLEVETE